MIHLSHKKGVVYVEKNGFFSKIIVVALERFTNENTNTDIW